MPDVSTPARPLLRDPFAPIVSTTPSADIVVRIREAILDGGLSVGEQLPPERRLTELFAVSRGAVRDAIRTLHVDGFVEVRVGARGGTFVSSPGPEQVASRITHMLALSGLTAIEVTEARAALELGILTMVCERRTDDDLAELDQLVAAADGRLQDGDHTFELSVAFHVRLAQASHSPAAALILAALQEPLLRSMVAASAVDTAMAEHGVRDHRELVDAIRARDPERAERVMAAHLDASLTRLGSARSPIRGIPVS